MNKEVEEYQERFKEILGDINVDRKDDEKYFSLSGKLALLVGNMLGHIEALELLRDKVLEMNDAKEVINDGD